MLLVVLLEVDEELYINDDDDWLELELELEEELELSTWKEEDEHELEDNCETLDELEKLDDVDCDDELEEHKWDEYKEDVEEDQSLESSLAICLFSMLNND